MFEFEASACDFRGFKANLLMLKGKSLRDDHQARTFGYISLVAAYETSSLLLRV